MTAVYKLIFGHVCSETSRIVTMTHFANVPFELWTLATTVLSNLAVVEHVVVGIHGEWFMFQKFLCFVTRPQFVFGSFSDIWGIKRKLISPKLTRPTLFWVHCVPQEGGRMQGWESKC